MILINNHSVYYFTVRCTSNTPIIDYIIFFNNMQAILQNKFEYKKMVNANKTQTTVAEAIATSQVAPANDNVQLSSTAKPERKGLVKTVNQAISNFKKFFASAEAYTVAGVKGVGKSVIAGSLFLAGGLLVNEARKLPAIIAKKGKDVAQEKIAKLAKNNKFIAVGAALCGIATFATTLWKASLDLNEKKSGIEHRYEGHKQ